ncbi:MAG: hypothetical protein R3B53_01930 [Candidatus Paceibacterota bacterium]
MVFDISSSTNPIYVAGRDASGDGSGISSLSFQFVTALSNYIYLGKQGNSTACSQTPGSATGCELMVFDISSSTNPTTSPGEMLQGMMWVGSIQVRNISIFNNNLYVGKVSVTACSQTPAPPPVANLCF